MKVVHYPYFIENIAYFTIYLDEFHPRELDYKSFVLGDFLFCFLLLLLCPDLLLYPDFSALLFCMVLACFSAIILLYPSFRLYTDFLFSFFVPYFLVLFCFLFLFCFGWFLLYFIFFNFLVFKPYLLMCPTWPISILFFPMTEMK